jgi:hypothetical protein
MRIDAGITNIVTAGTQVRILNTKDKIAWIKFSAPPTNQATTYVGPSDVSKTLGYPLPAHRGPDLVMDFRPGTIIADLIWVDADSDGDDVAWMAMLTI